MNGTLFHTICHIPHYVMLNFCDRAKAETFSNELRMNEPFFFWWTAMLSRRGDDDPGTGKNGDQNL
ncbi:hypothetical protein CSB45_12090 [candidate division KSB3 bacterium]|uniref:Uncharacterized protein n=1 Tax=candidate division KSB3 bacterium TaxID=2044937 RepID=A0A2G6E2E7_9BACT|nr:MAG: hypothetical protein CSB45_12090 [candidate division KSB3 bacterium]